MSMDIKSHVALDGRIMAMKTVIYLYVHLGAGMVELVFSQINAVVRRHTQGIFVPECQHVRIENRVILGVVLALHVTARMDLVEGAA